MAERKQGPVKPPVIDLTPSRSSPARVPRAAGRVPTAPDEPVPPAGLEETPLEPAGEAGIAPEAIPEPAPAEPTGVNAPAAAERDDAPVKETPAEAEPPISPPPDEPAAAAAMSVPPAAPVPRRRSPLPFVATALVGAGLGVAATLILLSFDLPPLPDRHAGERAAQAERIAGLEQGLRDSAAQAGETLSALDQRVAAEAARIDRSEAAAAALREELARIDASVPPPPDLAPLEGGIAGLRSRLDALAAGASSADAEAFAASIAALETQLQSIEARLGALDGSQQQLAARTDALDARLAAAPAEAPPPEAPSAPEAGQLQDVLAALSASLSAGTPFNAALVQLRQLAPEIAVPDELAQAAGRGLPPAPALISRFDAMVPEMMAARPVADGDWQGTALGWVTTLLALRPSEEQAGNDPDAVLSRLEAAMRRADFAAADALFGELPASMQQAASPLPGEVKAAAAAQALEETLRQRVQGAASTEGDAP